MVWQQIGQVINMSIKLITWNDEQTKKEIKKRYENAREARIYHEEKWIRNERTIYSTSSTLNMSYLQTSLESNFNIGLPGVDGSNAEMNVGYSFKNLRFIHAQMSANPPTVAMRPTNSDQENHRRADAADRIVRWALRHYTMQEKMDQMCLNTLLYGTGVMKVVWDSTRGDIIDYNRETEELKMEGDIAISTPFIWNLFLDPDAKNMEDLKWAFEKIFIDFDEACARWPDKRDILERCKVDKKDYQNRGRNSQLPDQHYNCVELLEYWETGLPLNGYLGRYCITSTDGDVVEPVRPSPCRFRRMGAVAKIEASDLPDDVKEARIKKIPEQAELPFVLLTDIDIPNMIWGRSFIEYTAQLQENLARLDSATLDNIQAHGVARMILPEGADINEDALSNSPWDITKITGAQPPFYMQAPALMPEMTTTRNNLIQGINDISGVNESMFGQQSREQATSAMQYATEQGNMIRRRLFNKYVLSVESIHRLILNYVRKHWTVNRTISVIGKERALEAIDIKGSDIDGGYSVVGEYGVTLSLDPITRRGEIMTMQPMFEKAGVPMRKTLEMLKLNELEGMYDELDVAGTRQKEIFDDMISSGRYVPPKKYRDHENMIAWAMRYFMSQEFESLPPELQQLCEKHIEDRATVAAQEKMGSSGTPATAQPPGPPGPPTGGAPAGAMPPSPLPPPPGGPGPGPGPAGA